jgi:hypothetical protein
MNIPLQLIFLSLTTGNRPSSHPDLKNLKSQMNEVYDSSYSTLHVRLCKYHLKALLKTVHFTVTYFCLTNFLFVFLTGHTL